MRRTKDRHRGESGAPPGDKVQSVPGKKMSDPKPGHEVRPKRARLRILIADDHGVVRRGVRSLIGDNGGWEICGEVADGAEAVAETKRLRPDVVLLDITMPGLNGLDATRAILREVPGTKVMILTMHESEQVVREVLDAGAHGYILKSDADCDLLKALEALKEGRPFFASKISQMVLAGYLHPGTSQRRASPGELTARQREVVALLASGKSNKEVATALGISVKTAETHRSTIMRRLKLNSFSDLVRYAVRERIIEL
jgi:DNA-binding NarL/FixJ family response regulator